MDYKPRRSMDASKPESETGVAEWASKIKAIQRQVDADDEAEQHKLEAEIAASRLARKRRSYGAAAGSRLDVSSASEPAGLPRNGNGGTNDPSSAIDRMNSREEAVRKLLGSKGVSSPTRSSIASPALPSAAQPTFQAQPTTKPDAAISLASFMGGRAAGPRLNRHAPQQDAHDPTQFQQRGNGRTDAPHPLFGRGGVALPGMTGKERSLPEPSSRDTWDRTRSVGALADDTTSTSMSPSPTPRRTEVNITAPASKSLEELRRKSGTSISSGASDASDATTSYSYSSYSQPRTTVPGAVRQTQSSDVNSSSNSNGAYRARDRGLSISSSTTTTTMRPKSPYSPPSPQPPLASLHVYGRRDTLSRSASPNASITSGYSRGKSPEPPKPASRPASRSGTAYNYSPNPSPITTPAVAQKPQSSAPPTARSASQATLMGERASASQSNFQVQPDLKPEAAISLASFMGGRATGPRLNRHAPQQDAHDPTQFEQPRDVGNTAPHPIFGRGGVAMPGMTTREVVSEKYRSSEDRRGAKSVAAQYEQTTSLASTNVPATANTRRERTISTPAWRNSSPVQGDYMKHDYLRRPTSQANLKTATTASDAASSTPNLSRPYTPIQQTPSSPVSPNPPWASPVVTTPSLARPIQPLRKQSPANSPQIPASKNPSRAFLRPPPEKEPTPSLTRLKGRGFVQNMVQTSSKLQANVNEFGASPPPSERPRPRSSSVLDRWQNAVSQSPTSSPAPGPVSPKPMALRKTRTVDVPTSSPDLPPPSGGSTKPLAVTKTLNARASLPSIPHTDPPPRPSSRASSSKHSDISAGMPPQDKPSLGSSSTLISYIKPNKTGDDPAPPVARNSEEGRAKGVREQKGSEPSPLKHPTKGRARKPQKHRIASYTHSTIADRQPQPEKPVAASTVAFPGAPIVSNRQPHPETSVPANNVPFPSAPVSAPVSSPQPTTPPETRSLDDALQSPPLSKAGRVTDRWSNEAIIGAKPISSSKSSATDSPAGPKPSYGLLSRRALPGLTTPTPAPATSKLEQPDKPDRSPATPLSPGRHHRIPSTGNRATVMDVAQSWNDALGPAAAEAGASEDESSDEFPEVPEMLAEVPARPRNTVSPAGQSEKRRSSYDRSAAVILPTLREEKTPAPSPAVTLTRTEASRVGDIQHKVEETLATVHVPPTKATPPATSDVLRINNVDGPLPAVDISTMKNMKNPSFSPDPNEITISVDVLRIAGNSATALLSDEMDVFYDTEVLAIVHRFKSKSSGLVATRVWSWRGQESRLVDAGTQKLQELCKRYSTDLLEAKQFREPPQLLHLLGGTLVVRQGVRAHWSTDNTAMHCVRSFNGFIIIQEHELSIANLCSGFSYCLTILDTLYVWHGRGSKEEERDAALKYAHVLAPKGSTVVKLVEGESDDDEMFWMMLGEDDYAKADYWQWRRTWSEPDPRVWRVDAQNRNSPCQLIPFIANERLQTSVYILDCVWECFILVGQDARGKRRDIQLAIKTAQELTRSAAPERPFDPTIHAIILPSQVPVDLQMHFRDFGNARMNPDGMPDHMNLLSLSEALEHLQRTSWHRTALDKLTMLPLGVDPLTVFSTFRNSDVYPAH